MDTAPFTAVSRIRTGLTIHQGQGNRASPPGLALFTPVFTAVILVRLYLLNRIAQKKPLISPDPLSHTSGFETAPFFPFFAIHPLTKSVPYV